MNDTEFGLENEKIFTVIIPMYNAERTIKETINSVCNQTRSDLISEIVIIDDGSTDDSRSVVENLAPNSNVRLNIINQRNKGVSAARNCGLLTVTTEWVALLDSDDLWENEKIKKQYEIISINKNIDFLGGNINDNSFKIYGRELPYLYKANIKDICLRNFPQPSTVIFRTKIFQEIGGFDPNQCHAEDQKYFLNICKSYNFYHLQEKLVTYGNGKRAFGESGLSSNLKKMYIGNQKNIKEQYVLHNISFSFYIFLKIFNNLKYLRRKIITILK